MLTQQTPTQNRQNARNSSIPQPIVSIIVFIKKVIIIALIIYLNQIIIKL